jgi:hypothetical protein
LQRDALPKRAGTCAPVVWFVETPSIDDAKAIAAIDLAHGHTLDGRRITRTLSEIIDVIEAGAGHSMSTCCVSRMLSPMTVN